MNELVPLFEQTGNCRTSTNREISNLWRNNRGTVLSVCLRVRMRIALWCNNSGGGFNKGYLYITLHHISERDELFSDGTRLVWSRCQSGSEICTPDALSEMWIMKAAMPTNALPLVLLSLLSEAACHFTRAASENTPLMQSRHWRVRVYVRTCAYACFHPQPWGTSDWAKRGSASSSLLSAV